VEEAVPIRGLGGAGLPVRTPISHPARMSRGRRTPRRLPAAAGDAEVGIMTATSQAAGRREVYLHDSAAPPATVVTPSVFAAVRDRGGRLLLVRRCDSGKWELPGGRVDVGESAIGAATREVREEAGIHIRVTGLVGLFTDPGFVVRASSGLVRQPFTVVLQAVATGGAPHGDLMETSAAAWVAVDELADLAIEPMARSWIDRALHSGEVAHLG
jgi:8-oxo-dGTP diphosphatase